MGKCGTLGRFFDPIEWGKWRSFLLAPGAGQKALAALAIRTVLQECVENTPRLARVRDTSGQAIQRAKGRQFTVFGPAASR